MRRTVIVVTGLVASAFTLAACSSQVPYSAADAQASLFHSVRRAQAGASQLPAPYATLAEALPNQLYNVTGDEEPAKSISGVAVVGNISNVQKGHCYYMPGGDSPSGMQIPFGDSRAVWCTIDATIDVSDVLASAPGETVGEEPPSEIVDSATVRLPLYPGDSFDEFTVALESLPDTVFFLSGAPSAPNEPDEFALTAGTLMAPIVDGNLTLPLLPDDEAAALLAGDATLAGLVDASQDSSVTKIGDNSVEGFIFGS